MHLVDMSREEVTGDESVMGFVGAISDWPVICAAASQSGMQLTFGQSATDTLYIHRVCLLYEREDVVLHVEVG